MLTCDYRLTRQNISPGILIVPHASAEWCSDGPRRRLSQKLTWNTCTMYMCVYKLIITVSHFTDSTLAKVTFEAILRTLPFLVSQTCYYLAITKLHFDVCDVRSDPRKWWKSYVSVTRTTTRYSAACNLNTSSFYTYHYTLTDIII